MQILKFKPIYKERVWGGRDLEKLLGRELPAGDPIGESWDVVDRPEAQSVVDGGALDGWTLEQLRRERGSEVFGPGTDPEKPFPILVKWLDCQERLSLQVHPPASVAPELGGEPKTENWYIARCSADASLTVGLKNGVTREDFLEALQATRLDECVHRIPVTAGDSILVESGRLHAIDGGNLILEIQQNSDTTYRVYDWGRVGLDGKPRDLHVDESMQSIDFNDFEPSPLRRREGDYLLAECTEFRIRKFQRGAGDARPIRIEAGDVQLLHVVEGTVSADGFSAGAGETCLVAHGTAVDLTAEAGAIVLVTDRFMGS